MRQLYVSTVRRKLKKTIHAPLWGTPSLSQHHQAASDDVSSFWCCRLAKQQCTRPARYASNYAHSRSIARQNIMRSQWAQKAEKQTLRFFNTAIHQYGSVVLERSLAALFAG